MFITGRKYYRKPHFVQKDDILAVLQGGPKITLASVKTNESREDIIYKALEIGSNKLLNAPQKRQIYEIIKQNNACFSLHSDEIGCVKDLEHSFQINDPEGLKKGNKVYNIPLKMHNLAVEEVSRLLKLGIIERSKSDYAVPSFFIF